MTDQLAVDVYLEAHAAAGIAMMSSELTEDEIAAREQAWARRVYQTSRALRSPLGGLMKSHRPDLHVASLDLLNKATWGYADDPESPRAQALPEVIVQALQVGRGKAPPPEVKKAEVVVIRKKIKPPPVCVEGEMLDEEKKNCIDDPNYDDGTSMPTVFKRGG